MELAEKNANENPWLTWLVIAFICAALGVMLVTPEHRLEVSSTIGLALLISLVGVITARQPVRAQSPLSMVSPP